jgi:hypothetical protein
VWQASFTNDRRFWLLDPCNLECWRKIVADRHFCDPATFQPGGLYFNWTEEAKRRARRTYPTMRSNPGPPMILAQYATARRALAFSKP